MHYPVGTKLIVPNEKRAYTVQASCERFAIATKPAFGTVIYFICDFEKGVRGPDSHIFSGGYETPEECRERLEQLQDGVMGVSYRRKITLAGSIISATLPDGTQGQLP